MNICIFAGARPNFIKVAPVIRAIQAKNSSPLRGERGESFTFLLVYAGCEDDPTLEGSLFDDLQIARPNVYLGVDCENLNELTGQVMSKFELFLQQHPVDAVIVVDDLASTMAAAIVTKKQGILLAHLAAGTRSFDISMPKEINRLVIDGLSDILFTAGISNNSIANKEGAELSKVYMVGNILIDNIRYNQSRWVRPAILDTIIQHPSPDTHSLPYLVFTLNRKALIADRENLYRMMVAMLQHANGIPIIAPLRQSAVDAIMSLALREQLGDMHNFHIVPPLNYLEFGWLTSHAKGIITDSGNVAEEATFNGIPCITLNSYTEHIETVKQGSNVLVGEDAGKLAAAIKDMVTGNWKPCGIPDRWDGRSAERILQILLERR